MQKLKDRLSHRRSSGDKVAGLQSRARSIGLKSATIAEILEEYEGLTQEDIQACFLFATKALENTIFMPLPWGWLKCAFW